MAELNYTHAATKKNDLQHNTSAATAFFYEELVL